MRDYVELTFGTLFLALGIWYVVNPVGAKRFWLRHGLPPRTPFGNDMALIIRLSGVPFVVVALFIVADAIRALVGLY